MRRRIQIALPDYWLRIVGCLFAVVLHGVEVSAQAGDSMLAIYTQKIQKHLDKGANWKDYFLLTKDGINVYASAEAKLKDSAEFTFPWNSMDGVKGSTTEVNLQSSGTGGTKLLSGYKIALDPGHIAGDLETAKMEKKWVVMKGSAIQLIEGELTLATALILKKKLEAQGATVMLTRDKPNVSSFDMDFKAWKDSLLVKAVADAYARGDISFEEKNYLLVKATDIEIFRRFFLLEDVRERARKINKFKPDVTLVIHYNVDETNTYWNKPTKKNYNMAFVGGSFTEDELDKPEARLEFVRLLLTDDLERSLEFSKYLIESLVQKTGVPAALDSNAIYLKDNCMKTGVSGVYNRNLTLTRKVKGVICYGESLYQDNISECKALSKKDASIDGVKTSKRVEEVAEAYYEGILNYVKSHPKSLKGL